MSYLEKFYKEFTREEAVKSCQDIIVPQMYKMAIPNAEDIQQSMPDLLKTKWSKLLEDVDKNSFILETLLRAMFKNETLIPSLISLQLSEVSSCEVTMIFGSFKTKVQQSKFTKLTQRALGDGFKVITVNGDETCNREAEIYCEKHIARAKRQGKKVIIVSKDMASRSFSVSEIDTVFLMYDKGLLSQTQQKVSRCLTPGDTFLGTPKTRGTIVSLSFDHNREEIDPIDLYIMAEANRIHDEDESMQDSIRRIANSVNIFQNDLLGKMLVDPDIYADSLLNRSSIMKDVISSFDFNNISYEEHGDIIISNRNSNPNTPDPNKITVNTSKVKTTSGDKEVNSSDKKEKDTNIANEEQFRKNIMYLASNITTLKLYSDSYGDVTLNYILDNIEEQNLQSEVEEHYGITFEGIRMLVDDKVLPVRLLNTVLAKDKVEEEVF